MPTSLNDDCKTPEQILIRNGTVLSMSGIAANDGQLDVLLTGDRIARIGRGIAALGATIIDATNHVVMPGLIDSHRHLWYAGLRGLAMDQSLADVGKGLWPRVGTRITPDDIFASTRAGILEALSLGITTVLDYSHALNTNHHADRAIEGHMSMPGRALFGYGPSMAQKMNEIHGLTPVNDWSHVEDVNRVIGASGSTRTSLALAIQSPAASGRAGFEHDLGTAREMGLPITAHMAVVAGDGNREITAAANWGLLGPDMHFSHCCGASDDEFRMMQSAGVQVTASPSTELLVGFGTPPIARMHRAGLLPAIGVDGALAANGDLFEEARIGLMTARNTVAEEIIAGGAAVATGSQLGMTTMEALETITTRAAAACFMSEKIGSLEVGKVADVILVARSGSVQPTALATASVLMGTALGSTVDTVIVDGCIVKREGEMVGVDAEAITQELARTRARMDEYWND